MKRMRYEKRVAVWILILLFVCSGLHPVAGMEVQAEETEEVKETETTEETRVTAGALNPDFDTAIRTVHSYIQGVDTNPDYGSVWKVIGMVRSDLGVSSSYTDTFYKNVYIHLEQNDWAITKTTYSSYSKLILALTAAGKDAQNIGGHNILAYLSDFSNVKKQGFMGPLWALTALKCHPNYRIPTDATVSEQTTEEGLIAYLLNGKLSSGGWALSGETADPDVTAMTIQALSSYYGKRGDVTSAIDQAVDALASLETESGGYQSDHAETAESAAQVITALSAIGIDAAEDSRFVKANGNWPMSGLFQFYLSQGGFAHVAGSELNAMATEQGMYAMAAYKRMKEGKTALYDMSDLTLSAGEAVAVPAISSTVETAKATAGTSASLTVAVSQIVLDYASVTVVKGKTKTLTAVVSPSSASNPKLKWSSSKKKVATVTQKGKIKAVKVGTAVITAKATDGSGVSASCVVKVVASDTTSKSTTSAGGQTKSTSGSSTKSLGTGTSTKTLGSGSTGAQSSTEAAGDGWSFSGEEYVPEEYDSGDTWDTSLVDDAEDSDVEDSGAGESWADKTLTIRIPLGRIFYTGMGGILVLVIEGIIWLIRRKRKERIISQ